VPSVIAHYLLAEKIRKNLTIRLFDQAFYCGAQGPDFLCFHRMLPLMFGKSLNNAGLLLHRENPKKTFGIISDYFAKCNNDIIKSYLLGFVCHYALDSIAHPYIYAMVDEYRRELSVPEKISDTKIHHKIESMLDVIILRSETGKEPTKFRLTKAFSADSQVRGSIASLYEFLLVKEFKYQGGSSLKADIEQALKDTQKGFAVINNTLLIKLWIANRIEKTFNCPMKYSPMLRPIIEDDDFDYSNSANEEWANPFSEGQKSSDSFFDLFEQSYKKADDLVKAFLDKNIELFVDTVNFLGEETVKPEYSGIRSSSEENKCG